MTRCGGQLWLGGTIGGRAGDRVPCPLCGKPVLLRRPFNNSVRWVQVPTHTMAPRGGHDAAK
jgi:hypothetical protein